MTTDPPGTGPPGRRLDVACAALVVLALLPGLTLALAPQAPFGPWHGALQRELETIEFGSGWRFWCGVAGAATMVALLLYPLRKRFGVGGRIGVARWFQVHIVLGLAGPVLILYHSNFGTGSLRANVALFTMLAIVVSGLAGHYVRAWISADFYGERRNAQELLAEAKSALEALGPGPSSSRLVEDLDAFEVEALAPRHGLGNRMLAAFRLQAHRRRIMAATQWLVASTAREAGWMAADRDWHAARIGRDLADYFSSAQRAARRSVGEQLSGVWRLLHFPLFAVTVVATAAHVYAVWGLELTTDAVAVSPPAAGQVGRPVDKPVIAQKRVQSIAPPQADGASRPATIEDLIIQNTPVLPAPGDGVLTAPPPQPVQRRPPQTSAASPAARPSVPVDKAEPPRSQAVVESAGTEQPPARRSEAPSGATPTLVLQPPRSPADKSAVPPMAAAPQPSTAVAELARRNAAAGDPIGRALPIAERLAAFEAQRFDHARTNFPLTGRHVAVACANCHRTTIENTPRTCISCHRKDDIHRGRRPTCESCHSTESWSRPLGQQ